MARRENIYRSRWICGVLQSIDVRTCARSARNGSKCAGATGIGQKFKPLSDGLHMQRQSLPCCSRRGIWTWKTRVSRKHWLHSALF
jgi:hypothetical protein